MTKFVEYDIFGDEIEDNLGLRGRYGEPGKRWVLVQRNSKRLTICDRYERPGMCFSGTRICTREWTVVKSI